jgi:hypothetical protein
MEARSQLKPAIVGSTTGRPVSVTCRPVNTSYCVSATPATACRRMEWRGHSTLSSPRSRLAKGPGPGLSMVYGFARESGGQVRVCTEPEKGTMVAFICRAIAGVSPPKKSATGCGQRNGHPSGTSAERRNHFLQLQRSPARGAQPSGQPIWNFSNMVFMRAAASSTAWSMLIFFCVTFASA